MSPWYDRPDGRPRTLNTDLVTLNAAQWFLRRSETEILAHVARGHLTLVGHRHDMLRADELRALRARLPRLGRGDWLK